MPTEAHTVLSESEVLEIEARHAKADSIVDDFYSTEFAIAASLNDIPALCATVKALRAENENLRAHVEERDSLLEVGIARVDPPAAPDERDQALAQKIAYRYLDSTDSSRRLENDIISALATVRAEARRAAFKEAIASIVGLPTNHYLYCGAYPMAAEVFRDNAVKALEAIIAIESARTGKVEG